VGLRLVGCEKDTEIELQDVFVMFRWTFGFTEM
jgi:hypothetical protein